VLAVTLTEDDQEFGILIIVLNQFGDTMSHRCILDQLSFEDLSELIARLRTVIHRSTADHRLKHVVMLVTAFE